MLVDKQIIECEIEYTKCFSSFYETKEIIRFRDDLLKDMYYHNYTYIKEQRSDQTIKNMIQDEISLRIKEEGDYCTILLNYVASNSLLSMFENKPNISINGYYSFDASKLSKLNNLPGCLVKKITNQKMLEDVLFCDLQHDEKELGKDFCSRRCYRRGKVYLSPEGVDSYVCYDNEKVIGNCDLFMINGVAKIEDFAVIPTYQRKGYGTTILKALIDIALKNECHTIYLVADENDTPKEMYLKIGFTKIGETSDLFFKFKGF